jgi:hypothetical protein
VLLPKGSTIQNQVKTNGPKDVLFSMDAAEPFFVAQEVKRNKKNKFFKRSSLRDFQFNRKIRKNARLCTRI